MVQEKEIIVEGGLHQIVEDEDGNGKWEINFAPNQNGTNYYKVTESTKYQEREILETVYKEDGVTVDHYVEGDLLYIQADGTRGTTVTDKPVMSDKPLPGVTYDEKIYYLKYVDGVLEEVRVVVPSKEEDPFADIESYTAEEIGEIANGKMPIRENPLDKLIEYITDKDKDKDKVHESAFDTAGKEYDKDKPLRFLNNFGELPTGEAQVEGDKNLTGKDLEDGEFEFVLTDKDGNVLLDKDGNELKGKNDKNGNFVINVPIDHEGEFEFYLREAKGNNPDITYDGTIYRAKIKVTFDRLTNTLVSKVVYMDAEGNELDPDKVQFSNIYTPPTTPPTTTNPDPDPERPPTPIVPPIEEIIEELEIEEKEVEELEVEEKEVEELEIEEKEESIIPMLPKTGIADISLFIGGGISSLAIGAYLLRKKN